MSEPIPESIPTSMDKRSQRPTKLRALTPSSTAAATISTLMSDPTKNILLPPTSAPKTSSSLAAPPEIVANVQGSSAGAGSGEFHVYKASRRREYERVRLMEDEARREKEDEEFERKMEEMRRRDEEKTGKNRKRRDKAKARKGKVGTEKTNGEEMDAVDEKGLEKHGAEGSKPGVRNGDSKPGKGADEEETGIAASYPEETGVIIHDDN